MKAVVQRRYGSIDDLEVRDDAPRRGERLVDVGAHAHGVAPVDGITAAGQPDKAGFEVFAAAGYTTVIDMSNVGASGVSGCDGDIHGCGASPGAGDFIAPGIVLMLSVPPATTTRSMPAAIEPAPVAIAPRPEGLVDLDRALVRPGIRGSTRGGNHVGRLRFGHGGLKSVGSAQVSRTSRRHKAPRPEKVELRVAGHGALASGRQVGEYAGDGGRHHGRQRAAEHRPQAEARQVCPAIGGEPADTAELDGNG